MGKAASPKKSPLPSAPDARYCELVPTRTIVLTGTDVEAKRAEILDYFNRSFTLYESLFECLKNDEAFFRRADPLRHPLVFYYGHTSVFLINKLNVAGFLKERIDPRLESMLAIGVDEMSWDDLDEKHYDWPSPAEVKAYRDKTRAVVSNFIRTCDMKLPISWEDPMWIILMGIEHERIHLETSAVLIRQLPVSLVQPHPLWSNICRHSSEAPENKLLPVKGGEIRLGKDRDDPLYGWDNEYGREMVKVADFKASQYLVSNREFLDFVNDGGYAKRQYWTEEGWNWAVYKHAQHPLFWVKDGSSYRYRSMLEEIRMPWDWPAEVNYLEAKAFCNWKAEKTGTSIRLPTEAEWHCLRGLIDTDQPYWDKAPGNINLEHYMSSCPVNEFAFAGGFYDIIGNAWQWTETPIDGFPGFEVHPAYDDFSTPTFDGKHNIIKGGCWVSTGNYAIKDSRYAFRRHFFQCAGLRYVEAEELNLVEPNIYETDSMVAMYVEFHYGDEYFGVKNFPKACADICLDYAKGHATKRALDIGCATGRSAFELARAFDHVDAVDFSARLIQAPVNLQKTGRQRYTIQDEGELVSYREASLEALGLSGVADKVAFLQGDACNLNPKFKDYDLVFAGNLLDRLYDPALFLQTIPARINAGGLLVLTSPYTWLEEFTERAKWLGGFKAPTGESFTTLDGLKNLLFPQFELVGTRDVPFVIRETRRKFQHTISELSAWRKI